MIRKARWVLALLAVALGLLHTFIATTYEDPSLWFVAAGGGIIAAGLLNIVGLRAPADDRLVRLILVLANAGFAAMFVWAFASLQQPQVVVGFVLFAALGIGPLWPRQS